MDGEVLDKIRQAINLLQEIEEYGDSLGGEDGLISVCDRKIDYWEHYLEFKKLIITQSYNINKEIKNQRIIRRKYKNDSELIKVYKDNIGKLINSNNRDILLTQLFKTDNRQKNAKYSYDAYTVEEANAILGIKEKIDEESLG